MPFTTALLSCALAAFMAFAGTPKLSVRPRTQQMARHLRVPTGLLRLAGLAEVVAAIGLLVGLFEAWAGLAAGAGVTLLTLGAAASHLRVRDPLAAATPALAAAAAAACVAVLHAVGG
ncbi:DoxX family protein [Streptomyces sp. NPDC052023]|uniref:DoxX family protein n=1 Tax=Streptomyces sp. NPDC052023 TaxID=3365681 RepID=UPI0037CD831F